MKKKSIFAIAVACLLALSSGEAAAHSRVYSWKSATTYAPQVLHTVPRTKYSQHHRYKKNQRHNHKKKMCQHRSHKHLKHHNGGNVHRVRSHYNDHYKYRQWKRWQKKQRRRYIAYWY